MALQAPARPDTSDMVVVHRVFRREFRLLPQMVRSVVPGDSARAQLVAQHCAEMVEALHHHHTGEDDLVWPVLHERVALQSATVARMEQQHEQMSALLEEVDPRSSVWVGAASQDGRDALADLLEEVSALLDEHLAEEERTILPLAAEHMTVQEWSQLGERGMTSMPRDRLVVFLAHILEDATPQERTAFLAHVPLPGRLAYRLVGRRKHARETAELRRGLSR